jgi:hypothetical protein
MILIYDATSGSAEHIATVEDGEQTYGGGEFDVDIMEEDAMLHRYDGPYIIATKVDDEDLQGIGKQAASIGLTLDDWQRYEGPRGGKGWINTETGEKVYQEEKPGSGEGEDATDDGPAEPIPHDELEPGDEFTFYHEMLDENFEGVVTEVDEDGPKVFIGPDRDDRSQTLIDGKLPSSFDVYPDDDEGALDDVEEIVDDGVEEIEDVPAAQAQPHESFDNPPRATEPTLDFDDLRQGKRRREHPDDYVVWPDGTQGKVASVYRSSVTVELDGEEQRFKKDELVDQNAFALKGRQMTPEEFRPEERKAVAVAYGRKGAPKVRGGVVTDWKKWGEVLDTASDETLADALMLSAISYDDFPEGLSGSLTRGYNSFMNNDVQDDGVTQSENPYYRYNESVLMLAPITSRMSEGALLNAVDNVVARIDEEGSPISDHLKRRLFSAAFYYTKEPGAREALNEKYPDDTPDVQKTLLGVQNKDEFLGKFIGSWSYKSGSTTQFLIQHALSDLGPNDENESALWAKGYSVGQIHIPDGLKKATREVYEDTQSKLPDKPATLYRGVRGRVSTHNNLESWSELRHIADEFGGERTHIMKAEVEPTDVFATWETLGDAWPEEDVKGKKEWMVLGGALA